MTERHARVKTERSQTEQTGEFETVSASRSQVPSLPRAVARPRLFRALEACTAPVAWVHGPAGSGKTWGVASYVARQREHCIWYEVRSEDRGAVGLVAQLGLALAERGDLDCPPRMAPVALSELESHARRFFERLLLARRAPALLVLDNVHTADDDATFAAVLAGLCSALQCARARLIVTSRGRPARALSRWVVGEAVELIDPEHLRFDHAEVAGLISGQTSGLDDYVERVLNASNGWAACAALLARAARASTVGGTPDRQRAEILADYIEEELLSRLLPGTRRALEALAFLPSIAQHHVQAMNSGMTFEELLKLVEQLGIPHSRSPNGALQLHDLVREKLRDGFIHTAAPTRTGEPLAAALLDALWADSQLHEASQLAAALGWHAELARALRASAGELLAQGREDAVGEAVRVLPRQYVEADGWLELWLGVTQMVHEPAAAARSLEHSFELMRAGTDEVGAQLVAAALVQVALHRGDAASLAHWMRQIVPARERKLPAHVEAKLTAAELMAHHASAVGGPAATDAADRAFTLLGQELPVTDAVALCGPLALVFIYAGRVPDARATLELARRLAARAAFDQTVRLTYLYCTTASIVMACGDAAQGLVYAEEVLELAAADLHWVPNVAFAGTCLALSLGEPQRAQRLLDVLERHAVLGPQPLSRGRYLCGRAHLRHARGELDGALADVSTSIALGFESCMDVGACVGLVLQACIEISMHQFTRALDTLGRLRGIAEHKQSVYLMTDVLLLEALLALEQAGLEPARASLARAFALARSIERHAGGTLPRRHLAQLVGAALELRIEPELALRMAKWAQLRPPHDDLGPHWAWPLVIRTLGGPSLKRAGDGAPVELQSTSLRPLKSLLASHGQCIALERLARELWPGRSAKASRSALDTALHRLRKQLGDDTLVVLEAGMLRLDAGRVWSDVTALQQLASRIERRAERAGLPECERLAEQLFDLYRGAFCDGDVQPTLVHARERFTRVFVGSLQHLVRRACALQELETATHWLEQGLAREDASELLHRLCIEVYVKRGLMGEAARALARCRALLRARFRVEPSAQTERLLLSIHED